MIGVVPTRVAGVWFLLVLVTAMTFWVGTGHHGGERLAPAIVVVAGFGKAFLVGYHFMEIREAPLGLRLAFTAWIAIFALLCVGFLVS